MVNEEPKATTNSQHRQIAIERLVATEIRLTRLSTFQNWALHFLRYQKHSAP